jgi:hypothetical protein
MFATAREDRYGNSVQNYFLRFFRSTPPPYILYHCGETKQDINKGISLENRGIIQHQDDYFIFLWDCRHNFLKMDKNHLFSCPVFNCRPWKFLFAMSLVTIIWFTSSIYSSTKYFLYSNLICKTTTRQKINQIINTLLTYQHQC